MLRAEALQRPMHSNPRSDRLELVGEDAPVPVFSYPGEGERRRLARHRSDAERCQEVVAETLSEVVGRRELAVDSARAIELVAEPIRDRRQAVRPLVRMGDDAGVDVRGLDAIEDVVEARRRAYVPTDLLEAFVEPTQLGFGCARQLPFGVEVGAWVATAQQIAHRFLKVFLYQPGLEEIQRRSDELRVSWLTR